MCGNIGRELGEPIVVRVIGSLCNCRSGNKIVIATSEHHLNYKFEEKVYTYDPTCQVLQDIRSVTETYFFAARLILVQDSAYLKRALLQYIEPLKTLPCHRPWLSRQ